jgi:hypothetical protein
MSAPYLLGLSIASFHLTFPPFKKSALGTIYTECQRYFKKRGLMRLSAMLPKRVIRKKIERSLGYLRETIHDLHNEFEVIHTSLSHPFCGVQDVMLLRNGLTSCAVRNQTLLDPVTSPCQDGLQSKMVRGLLFHNVSRQPRGK